MWGTILDDWTSLREDSSGPCPGAVLWVTMGWINSCVQLRYTDTLEALFSYAVPFWGYINCVHSFISTKVTRLLPWESTNLPLFSLVFSRAKGLEHEQKGAAGQTGTANQDVCVENLKNANPVQTPERANTGVKREVNLLIYWFCYFGKKYELTMRHIRNCKSKHAYINPT